MYTKYLLILMLSVLALLFSGCQKTMLIPAPSSGNDALLLPGTQPLDIQQKTNMRKGVYFTIPAVESPLLFIGIFKAPPSVVNQKLVNESDLIWQWTGTPGESDTIQLSDGRISTGVPVLNEDYWTCNKQTLYWGAWAWDKTGLFVTRSSQKNVALTPPVIEPKVVVSGYRIIGDYPTDTLLVPGKTVKLELTFTNRGNTTAKNIRFDTTGLSKIDSTTAFTLPELAINETATKIIQWKIPPNLTYGDTLKMNVSTTFNNCKFNQAEVKLVINALNVCIKDIRLIKILYPLPSSYLDFFALQTGREPDIYFELHGINRLIWGSTSIDDVKGIEPNKLISVDWPDFVPCIKLELTERYRLEFWDKDELDSDDHIGDVTFSPIDYIKNQKDVIQVTSNKVIAEIHLEWE